MTCTDYCNGSCPLYLAIPVKLHTPKGAARAMLVGKALKGENERVCYFDTDGFFFNRPPAFFREPLTNFSGLWEELE
jgi:hypothetical protein